MSADLNQLCRRLSGFSAPKVCRFISNPIISVSLDSMGFQHFVNFFHVFRSKSYIRCTEVLQGAFCMAANKEERVKEQKPSSMDGHTMILQAE